MRKYVKIKNSRSFEICLFSLGFHGLKSVFFVSGSVEDDAETQSSEFDFDDVSESFYSSMKKSSKLNDSCVAMEPDSTTPSAGENVTLSTEISGTSITDPVRVTDLTDEHTGTSGDGSAVDTSRVDLKSSGEERVLNDASSSVSRGKDTIGASSSKDLTSVSSSLRTTAEVNDQSKAIKVLQKETCTDSQYDFENNKSQSVAKEASKTIPNEKAISADTRDCVTQKELSQKETTQILFENAEKTNEKIIESDEAESSCAFTETEQGGNIATEQQKLLEDTVPSTVKKDDVIKQVKQVVAAEQSQELVKTATECKQRRSDASEPNKLLGKVEINEKTEKASKGISEKSIKLVEPMAAKGASSTSPELTDAVNISETEKVEEKLESASTTNGDSEDSVPPLLSAEDLSKIAATRKQTIDEEPPKLTKMAPAKRGVSNNNLAEMISKLKTRVQHSDLPEKDSESSLSKQSDDSDRLQQEFEPSSPESELSAASPESVMSDNSRSEVTSRTASEVEFKEENNPRMPGKGNKGILR